MAKGLKSSLGACFCVWFCFFLINNCRCMCCCGWCICTIFGLVGLIMTISIKGLKAIYGNKNINLPPNVVGEKVENIFSYMCCIFQNNSCDGIPKSIMGCNVFTLARALKQMNTQIINVMSTLTTWKMCNYRMWQIKLSTYCCKEMD